MSKALRMNEMRRNDDATRTNAGTTKKVPNQGQGLQRIVLQPF
ncbi:MAG: hypothetical protein JWR18_2861 [Segetibacter sp.]|jgi:hypothetical protein|nr:hypothetical protein [Segetibacter sp.]